MYLYQKNKFFFIYFNLCKKINFFKKLKEKIKSIIVPRASSRIQYKIEEKKRQKEAEYCQRQVFFIFYYNIKKKILIQNEIKRLLEEKKLPLTERKQALDELFTKKSSFTMVYFFSIKIFFDFFILDQRRTPIGQRTTAHKII